ncbi:uncharacterized protein KIAA1143 homolog [Saccostrea echinata]|uniref:uncharacterized protein KIAA1143 homolog n=1 Tax=Saccostrea echinata TaxID=191078 RepID=UPI002A819E72|nr:uncharacterized protein KIAA1143 homolog [Saccostrea echinata]
MSICLPTKSFAKSYNTRDDCLQCPLCRNVKDDEPDFIKKFKQRVGYKEGPTVNTKHEIPNFEDEEEDRPDNEDEKPVIVQLREGDLSAEEVERLQKSEEPIADGKITFKKPVERSGEEATELKSSAKKRREEKGEKKEEEGEKKSGKAVKNSSLLSFNQEDEEDAT